jgi:molecular chaperone GrpE
MHDENPPQTQQPASPGRAPRDAAPAGDDSINPNESASTPQETSGTADLHTQLQSALAELAQTKDGLLRALADVENMRKRSTTELANAHKYAVEGFASNLLPVRDTLEMALADKTSTTEQLRTGVDLTLKNLAAAFDKAKVIEINPLNQKFDPSLHQAVSHIDSNQPANTVVQVFQKGYKLQDRVLRPAMVAVAKGPAPQLRQSESPVESKGN